MMRSLRHWPWMVSAIAIAVVVHIATLIALPRFVMWHLLHLMASASGYNTVHHSERASASSRGVVRPSPDLLYSACPYDLSRGPLLVRADVPEGTYWSVSAFDADTNNFYVRDDRESPRHVEIILVARDGGGDRVGRPERVVSPTMRGLVLFRTLIDDEAKLAEIDSARRRSSCETLRQPPGDSP